MVAVLFVGSFAAAGTPASAPAPADSATITGTAITVEYPLDGTLFPPGIAPPTFRWCDPEGQCDAWTIALTFTDGGPGLQFTCVRPEWTPDPEDWETIQRRSLERDATVTICGVRQAAAQTPLSRGQITIRTSRDEVGAPLFYREVNLPFAEAVKDPTQIRWRFGPISAREPPPVVLTGLPVCGNCHSFSADGKVLGMDVDYANDKGSYALTAVRPEITLAISEIITWSDFRREDGTPTFGLLSQVSPDGRYAVSTVKDRSVFVATPNLAFSQLFFPIRGILAVYDRQTRTFRSLPGADDPEYVQSNPSWSPDGQYIVFARSRAYRLRNESDRVLLTAEECAEFLQEGRQFQFDLYRIPFNGGAGGQPEPLAGASHNGMSNFFARYSPDGKWIVFCRARNYMLLQPDSELYIIPASGGEARRMRCNTGRMNSWHSWSPNSRWLVFASKAWSDYTQLLLTHIDENGESTPPVLLSRLTAPDRAANIPEFVNAPDTAIVRIRPEFVDDVSYVRAGDAFLRAHDVPGAIRQFRMALQLNPNNAVAHSNLGGLLVTVGQLDEGIAHLREALRLDPDGGSPHYTLGMLRARQGRVDEAIDHLTRAVRSRPELADAQRVLGVLLCNRDRVPEGVAYLREAVRLDPNDPIAHYCLGKALAALQQTELAATHLAAALRIEPDYVNALHLLGLLEFEQRQFAEAIRHLSHAADGHPDHLPVLCDLALMLALCPDPSLRDPNRATLLAERACRLTGYQAAVPLDALALAHAAAGRFPAAVKTGEQALQCARRGGLEGLATAISGRLEQYRQQRVPDLANTLRPAWYGVRSEPLR